jgi:hypothetical protein
LCGYQGLSLHIEEKGEFVAAKLWKKELRSGAVFGGWVDFRKSSLFGVDCN